MWNMNESQKDSNAILCQKLYGIRIFLLLINSLYYTFGLIHLNLLLWEIILTLQLITTDNK